jgi:hypothetical protein
LVERALGPLARRWPATAPRSDIRLHDSLQAIYANRPAIATAFSLHELAWLLGAFETWIALWLMGVPVSATEAMILESLSQALRAAVFPVPSGLGIQEGGFIALGGLFGIPPEAALALSFVKRVPDLAIGRPGLLAWYWLEMQRLLPIAIAVPPPGPHGLRVSVIYDRSAVVSALTYSAACPVNSWNEWDPLEEVIVGRLDGAVVPPFHVSVTFNRRHSTSWLHRLTAGRRYPRWMARAHTELDGFVRLLEAEGVRVRRPEPIDQRRRVRTRLWSSRGFCLPCPRDLYLVVGDEIIETPTCWRSRHFESDPTERCSRSISPMARAGPLRRGHSCPTSCSMQATVFLNPGKPSAT